MAWCELEATDFNLSGETIIYCSEGFVGLLFYRSAARPRRRSSLLRLHIGNIPCSFTASRRSTTWLVLCGVEDKKHVQALSRQCCRCLFMQRGYCPIMLARWMQSIDESCVNGKLQRTVQKREEHAEAVSVVLYEVKQDLPGSLA